MANLCLQILVLIVLVSVTASVDYCYDKYNNKVYCYSPFNQYCEQYTLTGEVSCQVICIPSTYYKCCSYTGCYFPPVKTTTWKPYTPSVYYYYYWYFVLGGVVLTAVVSFIAVYINYMKKRNRKMTPAVSSGHSHAYPIGQQAYNNSNTFSFSNPAAYPTASFGNSNNAHENNQSAGVTTITGSNQFSSAGNYNYNPMPTYPKQ